MQKSWQIDTSCKSLLVVENVVLRYWFGIAEIKTAKKACEWLAFCRMAVQWPGRQNLDLMNYHFFKEINILNENKPLVDSDSSTRAEDNFVMYGIPSSFCCAQKEF